MNDWPEVSQDELDALLSMESVIALVYFYTPWCAPCLAIAPALRDVARIYGARLPMARVDVDTSPSIAASYGIADIPAIIMFRSGKEVTRTVGFSTLNSLKQWIDDSLKQSGSS